MKCWYKVYCKSAQSVEHYGEEMDKFGFWLYYQGQYKIRMKGEFSRNANVHLVLAPPFTDEESKD